jgi:dihydroorotate dehydrogenase
MPDWSYRTLFRPALFRLPSRLAREITLQAIGGLSQLPWGSSVIRTLGHMEVSPLLQTKLGDVQLKSPVGLSGGLDIHGKALKALSQFGFGFLEIGPITINKITCDLPIGRDLDREAIIYPVEYENDEIETIIGKMKQQRRQQLPLMVRLKHSPGCSMEIAFKEHRLLLEKLSPYADGFYIDILDDRWPLEVILDNLESYIEETRDIIASKLLLLYLPLDYPNDKLQQLTQHSIMQQWNGIVVGDMIQTENGFEVGRDGKLLSMEKIRCLRGQLQERQMIIATGGIHEPQDSIDLLDAGAHFVQLHSGLVYSGPGLAKRINDALVYNKIRKEEPPAAPSFWSGWGWMYLLGIAMIIGGTIAWVIAATSVVLFYDIRFLGMDRAMLSEMNDRLLPFMSHDRITLAGTMLSIGILYFQLARYGLRRGLHWSQSALFISGVVGFSSFFLYLGHGYFDPLHALVAAILLPMFFLSMREQVNQPSRRQPSLINDRTWMLAQWGQLMFIILGFALAIGGLTISFVGITHIFVPTDLAFMETTHATLGHANDKLLPLIAHDRAGFGGALFSNALAILATALWGINQGERWLWWTFLGGGLPGFVAVFSVHLMIGYSDFWHLLPAYFAFVIYGLGLILLYPYLVKSAKRYY